MRVTVPSSLGLTPGPAIGSAVGEERRPQDRVACLSSDVLIVAARVRRSGQRVELVRGEQVQRTTRVRARTDDQHPAKRSSTRPTRSQGRSVRWSPGRRKNLSCAGDTGGPCDAVSQHTDLLADTRSDGTVAIVNLHTLRLARILPDHIGDDDAVAWLPDGRTLVHGELNGELRFWDVTTGRITRSFRFADTVEQVTVSHDGKLLAVETQGAHSTGAWVEVVQIATGRVLQTHSLPDGSAGLDTGLEFSRDGRDLVALGTGSNVVVWDVRSGRRLWGREVVNASATDITPDSRLLGIGTQDGKVLLLDLRTGQQAQPSLQASDRSIAFVAFSPDGHTLAVADDQAVNLWDLRSRKPLGDTFGPYSAFTPQLVLEPNGRLLIVLGGNAEQWPTDVATWERFACGIVGRNLTPAEWADVLPTRPYRRVCDG